MSSSGKDNPGEDPGGREGRPGIMPLRPAGSMPVASSSRASSTSIRDHPAHRADLGESGRSRTFFCEPIGHVQVSGDYVESWQPMAMSRNGPRGSRGIAAAVTGNLGGRGLFGVRGSSSRATRSGSPRCSPGPMTPGLVALATQRLSEFRCNARAILGLPVDTCLRRPGPRP